MNNSLRAGLQPRRMSEYLLTEIQSGYRRLSGNDLPLNALNDLKVENSRQIVTDLHQILNTAFPNQPITHAQCKDLLSDAIGATGNRVEERSMLRGAMQSRIAKPVILHDAPTREYNAPSLYEFLKSRQKSAHSAGHQDEAEQARIEAMFEEIEGMSIINGDYITVYHATSAEAAKQIHETKVMSADENGLFFSTKPDGEILGYGDTILEFLIPARKLHLDDIFGDEAHLKMNVLAGVPVSVGEYLVSSNSDYSASMGM